VSSLFLSVASSPPTEVDFLSISLLISQHQQSSLPRRCRSKTRRSGSSPLCTQGGSYSSRGQDSGNGSWLPLLPIPSLSSSLTHPVVFSLSQLLDNSRLLRCTAPGREALNILSGGGSGSVGFGANAATSRSPSSYALSPIPSASSSFGGGCLSTSPSMSASSSSFNGLSGLGRRSFNNFAVSNSNAFEPQMRWGMTLGGRR